MLIAERSTEKIEFGRVNGPVVRGHFLEPLAALLDACLIFFSGIGSTFLYQAKWLGLSAESIDFYTYAALSFLASVLFVALGKASGFYQVYLLSAKSLALKRTFSLWLSVVAILGVVAFLLKSSEHFSRGTLIVFAFSGLAVLGADRLVVRTLLRTLMKNDIVRSAKVLLVRTSNSQNNLEMHDQQLPMQSDLRMHGYLLTHQIELELGNPNAWNRVISRIRQLIGDREIDEVFVEIQPAQLDQVKNIRTQLGILAVPVRLILDPVTQSVVEQPLKQVGKLLLSELHRAPLSFGERSAKRVFDIAIASSALVVLSPLILTVAILIKLDSPGPILFRQDRRGFSDRPFKILKFRSMSVTENGPEIRQAIVNDSRVTKIGSVIRKTSIDELPQLLNVLKGDMSIVGPRPHAVAHDDYYSEIISKYAFRHHVKPGLTGLSQVNGLRGETPRIEDMEARVETDLRYINTWSIWNDSLIVFKTALMILRGQDKAY